MATHIPTRGGHRLFVDQLLVDDEAPNILFCCTPIASVTMFRRCYEPLCRRGYNVFAFDLTGVGASEGSIGELTVAQLLDDFDAVAKHAERCSSGPLFVFGDTGIGGIIAQAYVAARGDRVAAFAQFGCANYRDVSPLGLSNGLADGLRRPLTGIAERFPGLRLPVPIPPYRGYHARLDNGFYTRLQRDNPRLFHLPLALVRLLLDVLLALDSPIQKAVTTPTLVFKTTHDRYFSESYFDAYYRALHGPRACVIVRDVHNSYYFYAERFAQYVAMWFEPFR